ncbi:MBL fold metallo-hydrolase [Rossellomorea marisflavi]|uniref:MBL fold metallo-hydrolase n=1 Tax=Rossellomorea marisflavi TaxID=189381 RepID=UPI0025B0693D|nr:MBL fold metallo-hydrolase [Rossellomorea marisflavi]WJV19629.1 MBL fold metallo-hydrolase [Rossellomorea marisflavi]
MNLQFIRNATLIIDYAGTRFLIDPMLAPKGTYPPFTPSKRDDIKNPIVDLPESVDAILEGIDAVILTHLHLDHFDDKAKEVLPKSINLYVQNEADAGEVQKAGFTNVHVLNNEQFNGIQLIKTKGKHGRGEILKRTGTVSGIAFKHENEKTLYVAGDTVWNEEVEEEILTHHPDIIVVNAGDNQFLEGGSIVMGKEDVLQTASAAPEATIISTHMEAVNHGTLSREELKNTATEKGLQSRILVPEDGESYTF